MGSLGGACIGFLACLVGSILIMNMVSSSNLLGSHSAMVFYPIFMFVVIPVLSILGAIIGYFAGGKSNKK